MQLRWGAGLLCRKQSHYDSESLNSCEEKIKVQNEDIFDSIARKGYPLKGLQQNKEQLKHKYRCSQLLPGETLKDAFGLTPHDGSYYGTLITVIYVSNLYSKTTPSEPS